MSNACFILILSVLQIVCLVVGDENSTVTNSVSSASSSDDNGTTIPAPTTVAATTTTTTPAPNKDIAPTRRPINPNNTSTHPPLVHQDSTTRSNIETTTHKGNNSGVAQLANILVVAISIFTIVPTVMY